MKFVRYGGIALGALLPVVAVVELAGNAWTASLVPPAAGFVPARRVVAEQRRAGDLVVVTPEWLADGRVALGDWMPLKDQVRGDILDYPRVWELALEGHRSPELAALPVEQRWSFDDGLTLALYRNTTYAPAVWHAYDQYGSATVVVRMPDGEQPLRWDDRDRQFHLDESLGQPWMWVGPWLVTDMEQQAYSCLWSHPTESGPLVISFADVPDARRLVVHTALEYAAARELNKKPVRLDVEIDGRVVGTAEQPDGAPWRTWEFEVPPGPARHSLRFVITTEWQEMRHFCWDATLRGEP
jgi:hypothetical protein